MSGTAAQRLTIRLTEADMAMLKRLCDRTGMNRSDSLRSALRQTCFCKEPLPASGYFVPVGIADPPAFPIGFERKDVYV